MVTPRRVQSTLPGSPKPADYAAIVVEKINQLCFPENPLHFMPYLHKQALLSSASSASSSPSAAETTGPAYGASHSPYVVYDPQTEYTRLGLLTLNEVISLPPCLHLIVPTR
jgi:hypothetical protein